MNIEKIISSINRIKEMLFEKDTENKKENK
ncbi:hypothetical protein DP17_2025 [Staphylococcus epidermidis]|nr:hypothetical protein DP17_2025 [Staphylococcus epidermidis]